jgi:hypothetical protein
MSLALTAAMIQARLKNSRTQELKNSRTQEAKEWRDAELGARPCAISSNLRNL